MMMKSLKMISVVLTVVLLLTVFVTPVAARQRGDRGESQGRGRQNAREIQYLDAEVRLINGQPVLKYETEEGYSVLEFPWPELAIVDGKEQTLVRQGDSFLFQTADGYEKIHIEEFEVALVSGYLVLAAKVNPLKLIPLAVVTGALVAAGIKISTSTIFIAATLILSNQAVNFANVAAQYKTKLISAAQQAGISIQTVPHVIERAINRGVNIPDMITIMTSGQRFIDVTRNNSRIVYHSGLRMYIVIDRTVNRLITVVVNADLKDWRWIPQNWNW